MRRIMRPSLMLASALAVAGCARTPKVAVAPVPPPAVATATPATPMPAGGSPGMTIPTRLSDGSFLTPNRTLTEAATLWHLRAALNVAALACRGPQEAAIVARYNALLRSQSKTLNAAQTTLAGEYRAGGGDWQDRYDDAMTRLYNYFSQSFARDAFCAEAAATLDKSVTLAPADLPAFAAERLPALDRPFVDFYRAYDAWRTGQMAPRTTPMIAVAAAPVPVPVARRAPAKPAVPWLKVDVAALQD